MTTPAKTNLRSTNAVKRNLVKWYKTETGEQSWQTEEAWTHMSADSVESFRADCMSYLGDKSNLATSTLRTADWEAVYDYFINQPETTDADMEKAVEALRRVSPLTWKS